MRDIRHATMMVFYTVTYVKMLQAFFTILVRDSTVIPYFEISHCQPKDERLTN